MDFVCVLLFAIVVQREKRAIKETHQSTRKRNKMKECFLFSAYPNLQLGTVRYLIARRSKLRT